MDWHTLTTDGRIEAIKAAHTRTSSLATLSVALGTSRSAVTGIYHRNREALKDFPLGGKPRGRNAPKPEPQKSGKPKPVYRKPLPLAALPEPSEAIGEGAKCEVVRLMEINGHQCRFPLNDGPVFYFCGEVADGSWCERHRRIVYERRV